MVLRVFADPRWLTSRLARGFPDGAKPHITIFAISLAWLAAVYGAACLDGTRTLPDHGKGFLQHNGYIVLHFMTPVALSLALLSLSRFTRIIEKPEPHFFRAAGSRRFYEIRAAHMASLNLRSRFALILLFGVIVGTFCAAAVFRQVINPIDTYGNDVFNAVRYTYGYYVANSYLALAWIVVVPFSLYVVIHITISVALLLHDAQRLDVLNVDLFHPDNCGGLSDFGDLNLLLTLYYVPLGVSIVALAQTHANRYTSLLLPAFILPVVVIAQAVIGVLAIYYAIQREKRLQLSGLTPVLRHRLQNPDNAVCNDTAILLWHHIRNVHAMPYADAVRYIQSLLPLITLGVGILQVKLM